MTLVMPCNGCNQSLEVTDLMTELPCCGLVMHSKCAFKFIADGSYHGLEVYCPGCSEPLWSYPTPSYSSTQTPSEAFLDEVKTLKPIVANYRRSLRAFRKKVKESKDTFRAQVAPHIDAIKTAKKAQKDAIKASDDYKTYVKFHRSYMRNATALATKYDIPVRTVNQQFKILWWRSNPTMYISKNLYIRI